MSTFSSMALAAPPGTLEQAMAASRVAPPIDAGLAASRDLRARAMQEAALSYGARSGLLRRSFEIGASLDLAAPHLDATWNFTPLMLTDTQPGESASTLRPRIIVPPVIVQANTLFKQEGALLIRQVDKTYKILTTPRFVPVVPTWRTYLYRDLGETKVTPPHQSLMPRTEEERRDWDRWLTEGWKSGVAQADEYFEYDLNRLSRDFEGMVLYHEMVAKKMVSLPYVASSNQAISGDDVTMNINDSMLRITVLPAFRKDSATWVPIAPAR